MLVISKQQNNSMKGRENITMVECAGCKKEYTVPTQYIDYYNLKTRCSHCGHINNSIVVISETSEEQVQKRITDMLKK
jgi:rRNA maturation endonuclease Nob1